MRKGILLTLITLMFYSIESIAQDVQVKCPDTVVISAFITTYGFNYKDIDTIWVKTFNRNTGYKKAKDSFYVISKNILADSIKHIRYIDIDEVRSLKNTDDWQLTFKHNLVYRISDFKTDIVIERHQFKRCKMVSYKLNGIKHDSKGIEIIKPGFKKVKVKEPKKKIDPNEKHRLVL